MCAYVSVIAAAGASLMALPGAQACGGFFCNQAPPGDPPPVAQTGENVLFAMERKQDGGTRLEAHVQIFYTGPADRFSWVLPVDGMPVLDVGSDRVFQVLDRLTRPRFGVNLQDEGVCADQRTANAFGASDLSGARAANGPGFQDPGVSVTFRGSVGPFDAVVLAATDATKLKAWLRDNMYFVSEEGERLLDDYVREQKFFVALKLLSGKGITEIRPLVLRFDGPGPCIPLRLTAIAATEDLSVNLWVLSQHRVVPDNYFEIKINPARIDWLGNGANYPDLLKQAANEAGGNAFAVDYVGPTAMFRQALVPAVGYDLTRLRTITSPPDAVEEILQRLQIPADGTLLAILEKYFPRSAAAGAQGLTPFQYYSMFRRFWFPDTVPAFDPHALADEIAANVIKPLVEAQALFDKHPKLTRLATFISPGEMSVDPTFVQNPTLPDVPAQRIANGYRVCGARAHTRCQAPIRIELPDGQKLWFNAPANGGWCGAAPAAYERATLDGTPALELAWQRDAVGEGRVRVDSRDKIAAALERHNASVLGCSCALGGRGGLSAGATLAGLCLAAALVQRRVARRRRRARLDASDGER